mmetsp:Transcript_32009/g.47591  ORF Transcript_32009/g.47591 Transcript_32009/m.47591 type:complete len:235 (+) Transcript_32009:155-859(+)
MIKCRTWPSTVCFSLAVPSSIPCSFCWILLITATPASFSFWSMPATTGTGTMPLVSCCAASSRCFFPAFAAASLHWKSGSATIAERMVNSAAWFSRSTLVVSSAARLNGPSVPQLPMPSTTFLVSRKGTVSAVGSFFPCSNTIPKSISTISPVRIWMRMFSACRSPIPSILPTMLQTAQDLVYFIFAVCHRIGSSPKRSRKKYRNDGEKFEHTVSNVSLFSAGFAFSSNARQAD